MLRKVFRTGDSFVVALPKEMLDALQIVEGSEVAVELDTARQQIVIAPLGSATEGVDAAFACQVADFIDTYRTALESLAQ